MGGHVGRRHLAGQAKIAGADRRTETAMPASVSLCGKATSKLSSALNRGRSSAAEADRRTMTVFALRPYHPSARSIYQPAVPSVRGRGHPGGVQPGRGDASRRPASTRASTCRRCPSTSCTPPRRASRRQHRRRRRDGVGDLLGGRSGGHLTGTSTGAPLSFTRSTRNFAGLVLLAFRPTTWTSSGPS
jgi:hypothetical protein